MRGELNKSSQNIASTGLLGPFKADERPLSERMRPSAPRYPETLAKCRPSSDSRCAASPRSEAPQAQAEGRPAGSLGNTAKYVGRTGEKPTDLSPEMVKEIRRNEARRERRSLLYFLQRQTTRLLKTERVGLCRWSVQGNDKLVEALVSEETGNAFYSGLQTCLSVWSCPVCSAKISEVRRREMNLLLERAREAGFAIVMVTLTASHKRGDDLKTQLSAMKNAKRALRQRRDYKSIKHRIVGSVTATEVTYGASGWHTHFHEIFIINPLAGLSEKEASQEAQELMSGFGPAWLVCLEKQGMTGKLEHAWHVQNATKAGDYAAKFGAAEEIVLGQQKLGKGKGRTPFQLLHDFGMEGDEKAGALFAHFALVFKGARQLVWSNGLKDAFGIDHVEDKEAGDEGEQQLEERGQVAVMGAFTKADWNAGVRFRRVRVLEAAETGDKLAVIAAAFGTKVDAVPTSSRVIEEPPDS